MSKVAIAFLFATLCTSEALSQEISMCIRKIEGERYEIGIFNSAADVVYFGVSPDGGSILDQIVLELKIAESVHQYSYGPHAFAGFGGLGVEITSGTFSTFEVDLRDTWSHGEKQGIDETTLANWTEMRITYVPPETARRSGGNGVVKQEISTKWVPRKLLESTKTGQTKGAGLIDESDQ